MKNKLTLTSADYEVAHDLSTNIYRLLDVKKPEEIITIIVNALADEDDERIARTVARLAISMLYLARLAKERELIKN